VGDALWDSAGIIACAGAAGGFGMLRYGNAEDAGHLFMHSTAINQHLFARSCRGGTKGTEGTKPSSTLLHLIVGTAIGTQLATILFPGLGLSLRTFTYFLADAAVLGLAGLSSRALFNAVENRRRREEI